MAHTRDDVLVTHRPDGSMLFHLREPIAPYPDRLTERLEHFAHTTPATVFIAQRGAAPGWETLSYGELWRDVQSLGEALLQSGAGPERPVAVLSGNDLDHARLMLACAHVGIPYAPIAPAYSLVASDFAKLRMVAAQLTPGLVYANNGTPFAKALDTVFPDVPLWVSRNPPPGRDSALLADLLTTEPSPAVAAAAAAVTPGTVAKILFTSGSTGQPKGVINTHRMLCANQAMIAQGFELDPTEPPVLLEWLPWNHTFGGNHDFNFALHNGGTLYIDAGRPTPGAYAETLRNLREIAPTHYLNVPKGFESLVAALRADPALNRHFFSRLRLISYAAANLSQPLWDELEKLALEARGERVPITTGFGSTETGPAALFSGLNMQAPGMIGLPLPGVTLKLAPHEGKLEARLRSPSVTPGYWRAPTLTEAAFDEEGFYKMGDALKLQDPAHPERGVRFDGRLAEDFKLDSGTWVSVGPLHARLLAALSPIIRDVVITGHDRPYLGILAVPDFEACATLCGGMTASPEELLAHPKIQAAVRAGLTRLAAQSTGDSTFAKRALFLTEPLNQDAGEITDKGSINQRAVLSRRADLVATLYSDPPAPGVITTSGS